MIGGNRQAVKKLASAIAGAIASATVKPVYQAAERMPDHCPRICKSDRSVATIQSDDGLDAHTVKHFLTMHPRQFASLGNDGGFCSGQLVQSNPYSFARGEFLG